MTIENDQAWGAALQALLGYSAYASVHTAVSSASAPTTIFEAVQDAGAARDIIHAVVVETANDAMPFSISVLVRDNDCSRRLRDCRLYAASHWSPIELLAEGQRWSVRPGDTLVPSKLPPANRRAKGEDLAMNRWRRAVEKMTTRAPVNDVAARDDGLDRQGAPDHFDIAA